MVYHFPFSGILSASHSVSRPANWISSTQQVISWATEEEHARLHARVHGCKALILDDLAVVLLRIFGKVTVPQRVIAVFNLYDRRVDVKRQRIFDLVVFDVAVRVLVGDVPGGG